MVYQNKNIQEKLKQEIERSKLPQVFFHELQKNANLPDQEMLLVVCYGNSFGPEMRQNKMEEGVLKVITVKALPRNTLHPIITEALFEKLETTYEVFDNPTLYKELEAVPIANNTETKDTSDITPTASNFSLIDEITHHHEETFSKIPGIVATYESLIGEPPPSHADLPPQMRGRISKEEYKKTVNKSRLLAVAAAAAGIHTTNPFQNLFPPKPVDATEERKEKTEVKDQPERVENKSNDEISPEENVPYNNINRSSEGVPNIEESVGGDQTDSSPSKDNTMRWVFAGAGGAAVVGTGALASVIGLAAADKSAQTALHILKSIACIIIQ